MKYPTTSAPRRARPLANRDVPLEERVDAYGARQRAGTGAARRARGREEASEVGDDEPGWWKHHGLGDWTYHGNGATPSASPL